MICCVLIKAVLQTVLTSAKSFHCMYSTSGFISRRLCFCGMSGPAFTILLAVLQCLLMLGIVMRQEVVVLVRS